MHAMTRLTRKAKSMRHYLLARLASRQLVGLTDYEIIRRCPESYGELITFDHLNLVWDRLYDALDKHWTITLLFSWLLEGCPDGREDRLSALAED